MAFNSTINTGTTPNDGQGDGLRTNLRKLIENDNHLKDQNTQFQQIVDNVLRSTKGVVTVNNNTYTTALKVTGDRLSSAIRLSINGTSTGVVVNVLMDVLVNHSKTVVISSQSGAFTQIGVKIVTNGNEQFAIELKTITSINGNTDLSVEAFVLNNESVIFTNPHPFTNFTYVFETKPGFCVDGINNTTNIGNITASGNMTCVSLIQTSDKKFKSNIELIDGVWALDVFKKLNFSFYDFSKTNSKQAGLIAQEVEKILPQAVHTSENGEKGLNHTYIDMICKAAIQHFIKTQIQ
ncbi:tail fiber domain-containing protein [uncultured Polaribacter sp.]|uniref:tail fiber domain-containing protein n=1 Tax=uncultured Polaribacter sp. TaxID=174711 RepID=UPI002620FFC7|nr:tail fiber domain-containing protein [uncultured Polaribacter sp.]